MINLFTYLFSVSAQNTLHIEYYCKSIDTKI
jgi:hypothetical protein